MKNGNTDRDQWKRPVEFLLSLIGFSVGMGSLWRFPYLAMRNGGGAFLIPYILFAVVLGIPVVTMETALGQYFQLSPLHLFGMCPLFKGLGVAITLLSFLGYIYLMVILAWTLYFLALSFSPVLPWATCDNAWNTNSCVPLFETTYRNVTNVTSVASPTNHSGYLSTEEFWRFNVLDLSSGIDDLGPIRWQLSVTMIVSFGLVFVCIFKGVASSRIAVYITATAPFLLLFILLFWLLAQPGSTDGIAYLVTPRWEKVATVQTWLEAFLQVFYSLGICWGGLINLSSYSPFHHNCLRSSVIVAIVDLFTAILCGAVVFAGVGCIAHQTGSDISTVITTGPGLSFITYPQVVASMPVPQFWSVCFFLLILFLGLDSQFAMVKTVTTGITDMYPRTLKRYQPAVVFVVLVISLLLSLPLITKGGMYVFQIVDWYCSLLTVLVVAILECVVIGWIYGGERFLSNIREMGDFAPSWYLQFMKYTWQFLVPVCMLCALILAMFKFRSPSYGDYVYPEWTNVFGWCLAIVPILPIPLVMAYQLIVTPGSFKERLSLCTTPDIGKKGQHSSHVMEELETLKTIPSEPADPRQSHTTS